MQKVENIHETPHDGKPLLYAVADLKRYSTIVVDPPWAYGIWGSGSAKALVQGDANKPAPLPYSSMTIEQIKALPLKSLANENCELYLWTTQKYLPDAFEVIKAWGFKYCQTLTWCKTPRGTGQGGIYCPTSEFLILARKGKAPKKKRIDSTWFHTKRTKEHSTKPEFFQEMIDAEYQQTTRRTPHEADQVYCEREAYIPPI